MNLQGKIIVWGTLLACILAILAGAWLPGALGNVLLAGGIIGLIIFLCVAVYIANAMNSDI